MLKECRRSLEVYCFVMILVGCGGRHLDPHSTVTGLSSDVRFDYRSGHHEFTVTYDEGAGAYDSQKASRRKVLERATLLTVVLPAASLAIGKDAARTMRHYLNNSGEPLDIDAESMVLSSLTAKRHYRAELLRAVKYCQGLENGVHEMTAVRVRPSYNYRAETSNWFFAVGGYSSWGQAVVKVSQLHGEKHYHMVFNYHVVDRYNWDAGKSVTIAGQKVTSDAMAEMHRMGIAREFNMSGTFKREYEWTDQTPVEEVYLQWPQLKMTADQQAVFVAEEDSTSTAAQPNSRGMFEDPTSNESKLPFH